MQSRLILALHLYFLLTLSWPAACSVWSFTFYRSFITFLNISASSAHIWLPWQRLSWPALTILKSFLTAKRPRLTLEATTFNRWYFIDVTRESLLEFIDNHLVIEGEVAMLPVGSHQIAYRTEEKQRVKNCEQYRRYDKNGKLVECDNYTYEKHYGGQNGRQTAWENGYAHLAQWFFRAIMSAPIGRMHIVACKMHNVIYSEADAYDDADALARAQLPPHVWDYSHNIDNNKSDSEASINRHEKVLRNEEQGDERKAYRHDEALLHGFDQFYFCDY